MDLILLSLFDTVKSKLWAEQQSSESSLLHPKCLFDDCWQLNPYHIPLWIFIHDYPLIIPTCVRIPICFLMDWLENQGSFMIKAQGTASPSPFYSKAYVMLFKTQARGLSPGIRGCLTLFSEANCATMKIAISIHHPWWFLSPSLGLHSAYHCDT